MKTFSTSFGSTKLIFKGICDLILHEDIYRRNAAETPSTVFNAKDKGRKNKKEGGGKGRSKLRKRCQQKNMKDITCWNSKENGHFRNQFSKASVDICKIEMNV